MEGIEHTVQGYSKTLCKCSDGIWEVFLNYYVFIFINIPNTLLTGAHGDEDIRISLLFITESYNTTSDTGPGPGEVSKTFSTPDIDSSSISEALLDPEDQHRLEA